MTEDEYILKGVELADEWDLTEGQLTLPSGHYFWITEVNGFRPWMVDALAAQLARQRIDKEPDAAIFYSSDVMDVIRRLVDEHDPSTNTNTRDIDLHISILVST